MYNEILVPTDGSPAAESAIEHAVDLAKRYGARIHGLYAVDATSFASVEVGTDLVVDALETEGTEAVARIERAALDAGLDVVTTVSSGTASRSILEYADEHDIDLVVMGTHGRRGVERFLMGSVTERVVRNADVPVMTVRMAPEDET